MDVLTAMKRSPMTAFQYVTIGICLAIVTIDGFDVFVMGFVLPHLPDGFVGSDLERGMLLSAGLLGMALGALLLSPFADRIGRRRVVVASLLVCTAGMLGSVFAANGAQLSVWRLITGVGIGVMSTSLAVLVQEYTSDRARGVVFGFYSVGFPLGSAAGGLVGSLLIQQFSGAWQAMFVFGTVLTLLALVLAWFFLPESVDYLVARNPRTARAQLLCIASRLGNPQLGSSEPQPVSTPTTSSGAVAGLFVDNHTPRTLLLWVAYSCLMIAFYFTSTWTPQLVSSATGSVAAGTNAGVILSAGAFIGALLFALLSTRFGSGPIVWISMASASVSMVLLAALFEHIGWALLMTACVGVFLYIAITAITTLILPLYPAGSRVAASGSMIGIGRLFSVTAPLVVGVLVASVDPATLYALSAGPLLLGTIAAIALWRIIVALRRSPGA